MVGSPYGRADGSDGPWPGGRVEPDATHAADARVDLWAWPGTDGDGHETCTGLKWRW